MPINPPRNEATLGGGIASQAGAIYGQSPPLMNASKPPGEWQTYDIIFESPRWNNRGELVKKACATVLHNGVVIQNRYGFTGITDGITGEVPWKSLSKYARPHPPEVFIELQDHNNPVRYRNVWVKYPNWYESFQGLGYDLAVQPKLFDAIYTGAETRDVDSGQRQPRHSGGQAWGHAVSTLSQMV